MKSHLILLLSLLGTSSLFSQTAQPTTENVVVSSAAAMNAGYARPGTGFNGAAGGAFGANVPQPYAGNSQYIIPTYLSGGRDTRLSTTSARSQQQQLLKQFQNGQSAEYKRGEYVRGFLNPEYNRVKAEAAKNGMDVNTPVSQQAYTQNFLYAPRSVYGLNKDSGFSSESDRELNEKLDTLLKQREREEAEYNQAKVDAEAAGETIPTDLVP